MILFFSGHVDAIHQYVKIMQHHAVCNHYKWIYHILFTIFHPYTYILIRKRNNKVIFLSFLLGLSVPYVDFTSFMFYFVFLLLKLVSIHFIFQYIAVFFSIYAFLCIFTLNAYINLKILMDVDKYNQ